VQLIALQPELQLDQGHLHENYQKVSSLFLQGRAGYSLQVLDQNHETERNLDFIFSLAKDLEQDQQLELLLL
jgi:hypothetical protein